MAESKKHRAIRLSFTSIMAVIGIVISILASHPLMAFVKDVVMVPMTDGVTLATDVYLPTFGAEPYPTILIRTPYGKHKAMTDAIALFLTDIKKYALVIQDTRGRFESEGADSMFFNDGWGRNRDGYDTVEWVAAQTWANGKVGMWGASALGITQYMAAGTSPPHLTCCLVMVAASNLYEDAIFYGGAYRRSLVDGWLEDNGSEHLIPYFSDHPNYESFYDAVNLSTRWDSVNVPILHVGGWHDIFIQGTLNAFQNIQERGGPGAAGSQQLLVGPWIHYFTPASGEIMFPGSNIGDLILLNLDWYDYWLKGIENSVKNRPTVKYYMMGDADNSESPGNRWIETDSWPPLSVSTSYYLHDNGTLSTTAPQNSDPPAMFEYDPNNPVPTIGGRNLNIDAGSYDQSSVESRDDVLVYSTDPLTEPLTIAGRVEVVLYAASNAVDTDFTAKLCDVYPDGRSMLVADGILQARHRNSIHTEEFLTPGELVEIRIDLWSTAIVFEPGHRIRLSISSSNFPRFEANPNTGEPFRKHTSTFIAQQTVYQDGDHSSALILPVVDTGATAVVDGGFQPEQPMLMQNFPNPFNQSTTIPVHWPVNVPARKSTFVVVDALGRQIISIELTSAWGGYTLIPWDGNDEDGHPLPSGIYIGLLRIGDYKELIKLTLVR